MKYAVKTVYESHTSHMYLITKVKANQSLACAEISPKASNGIRWLRWIETYPVNKVIRFSNNWGQVSTERQIVHPTNLTIKSHTEPEKFRFK